MPDPPEQPGSLGQQADRQIRRTALVLSGKLERAGRFRPARFPMLPGECRIGTGRWLRVPCRSGDTVLSTWHGNDALPAMLQ